MPQFIPDFPGAEKENALIDVPVYKTASQWGSVLVADEETVSSASYQVQAKAANAESNAVSTTLWRWGDVRGVTTGSPPDGVVNFIDVNAVVACFQGSPIAPPMSACDLHPAVPNGLVNFLDVSSCVDAFKGKPYPFTPSGQCP